ncbi:MAG: rRNA pseudouridine synthase [Calditrichaeota bacterium]|nr:rRNA pseudouridine synthase [Calditrichota bacterium]
MRLNKYIAHSGYCSRRKADELIFAGSVKVNDSVITNPATMVSEKDSVYVNSELLHIDHNLVYILLNKPLYTITSRSDEKNRETVIDLIETDSRIYPIGRLDYMTTGILLLSNDGELTQKLSHPSNEIKKTYRVTVKGRLETADINKLENGIMLDNRLTYPATVTSIKSTTDRSSFQIQIHEGRNRQIRRMIDVLGYELISLDRVTYAGLTYGKLARGEYRFLSKKEIDSLKKQAGLI